MWLSTGNFYMKSHILTWSSLKQLGVLSILVKPRRTCPWECHVKHSCLKRYIRFCCWLSTTPALLWGAHAQECSFENSLWFCPHVKTSEGIAGTPALSPDSWAETVVFVIVSFRDGIASGSPNRSLLKDSQQFSGGSLYYYVRLCFLQLCICPIGRRIARRVVSAWHLTPISAKYFGSVCLWTAP